MKGKETIKCCFLGLFEEVWKYEGVYKLMESNPRFEPMILVCPVINYGPENMILRMRQCYEFFKSKGYCVMKAYNEENGKYVSLSKDVRPDILFYTNPYRGLIDDRYFIDKCNQFLAIYVPYSINNSSAYDANYNLILHNLLWRHYLPTESHLQYAKDYSKTAGHNCVVTGYPGIEPLLTKTHFDQKDWRNDHTGKKRIIWAPHHTIEPVGVVFYSCFIRYCDFMVEMAKKYEKQAMFVFKPHPLLKNKLYEKWGHDRTDFYYEQWTNLKNTNLNEGEYDDLFLSSDAMIHDSGSFISEYLYTKKPVMRTLNSTGRIENMNSFAEDCLSCHYLGYNESDIEQFIQNVIHDIDPMKDKRTKFVEKVLMPKGSPSQNIVNDILDSIDNQVLYRN